MNKHPHAAPRPQFSTLLPPRAPTRGEHSVDSVAAACGPGASERLRRAFLRRLGINPRDYQSHFESAPASLAQTLSKA